MIASHRPPHKPIPDWLIFILLSAHSDSNPFLWNLRIKKSAKNRCILVLYISKKITCQIFSLAGGFFTSLQEKLKTESPCKSRFFGVLIFRNILDFAEDLRNFKKAYKGKFLTASKLWIGMTYSVLQSNRLQSQENHT